MPIALIIFVLVPITELWLLFRVSDWIGGLQTLLLVVFTAMIGVSLLKRQGVQTLLRVNQKMQEGQLPIEELAHGVMLAVAGAFLLTPGLITDTCGFALLFPGVRRWVAQRVVARMAGRIQSGGAYYHYEQRRGFGDAGAPDEHVIDGEFRREENASDVPSRIDDVRKGRDPAE